MSEEELKREEFWELVSSGEVPENQRRGQHLFNLLALKNRKLALKISGTRSDPFYEDSRIPRFLSIVRREWQIED